ncbi:lambda exonuclease family protein [Sphingomonas albertensis]|uniref:YqaJ viral recombinase family protein n=1 Tax=Sphingomonas albertensis TaxID=2762591 RepID=A0ABR7ASS1_9SPHN|nr:lambda exonuclease family protein [Sphingomonas albertensis]MBC3943337.1 YqaJ viral recombinase family protein [Sphingomonas albertensis]
MASAPIEQRTPEWFAARAGKVTASRIADVMAKTAKGWGASRADYLSQIVRERVLGQCEPSFTNAAMQWGTDQEPNARDCYAFTTGLSVIEEGFVPHPTITMAGASPDGLVEADGMVEIKCPNPATHQATLLGGPIADKYMKQMQFQMACTGRQWCDFASYDPRWGVDMQLHVTRVPRNDEMIAAIEAAVIEFLAEVERDYVALTDRYQKAA